MEEKKQGEIEKKEKNETNETNENNEKNEIKQSETDILLEQVEELQNYNLALEDYNKYLQKQSAYLNLTNNVASYFANPQIDFPEKIKFLFKNIYETFEVKHLLLYLEEESTSGTALILRESTLENLVGIKISSSDQLKLLPSFVHQSKEAMLIEDVHAPSIYPLLPQVVASGEVNSLLALPLKTKSATLGVLELYDKKNGEKFAEKEIEIIGYLLDNISLVLENTLLMIALDDSKKYINNILESMSEIIVVTDINFKITLVNKVITEMLGYPYDEVIGKNIFELLKIVNFAQQQKEIFAQIFALKEKGMGFYNFEVEVIGASTKLAVIISVTVAERVGSAGRLSEFIFNISNIQKIKNLQNQLLKSEKMATIGMLSTGVAHELNNPLAIMSTYFSKLKVLLGAEKLEQTPILAETVTKIKEVMDKMKKVVTHLREFSSMQGDAGALGIIQVNKVIENAFLLIEETMRKDGVEVNKELSSDVRCMVFGYEHKLEELIIDLLKWFLEMLKIGPIETKKIKLIGRYSEVTNEVELRLVSPFLSEKSDINLTSFNTLIEELKGRIEFLRTESAVLIILPARFKQ
ncbi:MAG: PAS domain S-box protein [Oligoflexia bacterium]|nr:PAS domain S-box protein [Oligoflexia bacterium]